MTGIEIKLFELAKEVASNEIPINSFEIEDGKPVFEIQGFSKSGTAKLTYNDNGDIILKTRYDRVDIIETFYDIASVAYDWFYSRRDEYIPGHWEKVYVDYGWIEVKTKVVTKYECKR